MSGLLQDLTFAFRLMRRSLGYTATAVITLAAGIGAATSIFSVVSGVLLQPLPYPDPDRLLVVRADTKTAQGAVLSSQEVEALQRSSLFEEVGAMNTVHGSLTGEGAMASVEAASVTDTFLKTLGVTPAFGRHLSVQQDVGSPFVTGVIISFELWQRHFGGDPGIIGRPIEVNNLPVSVVGVLPRGFRVHLAPGLDVPARIDLWFPRGLEGGPVDRSEIPSRGSSLASRSRRRPPRWMRCHVSSSRLIPKPTPPVS